MTCLSCLAMAWPALAAPPAPGAPAAAPSTPPLTASSAREGSVHDAAAAPSEETLPELRAALATYEPLDGTAAVLSRIHARIRYAAGLERDELRFLRAAVAADLLFIAEIRRDATIANAVASAIDTPVSELPALVDAELGRATGSYRGHARDVRAALAILREGPAAVAAPPGTGTHAGVLRLAQLRMILEREGDPLDALAPLAPDPCPDGAAAPSCAAPYRDLEARARRAAAALLEGASIVHRLQGQAKRGDQLARALSRELDSAYARLQRVELRPVPRVAADAAIALEEDAAALAADLILIVGSTSVRYGFAPRLRLGPEGTLVSQAPISPSLPAMEAIALPESYRPYLYALPDVRALIERASKDNPELKVAVGAEGDTPAHVLGRVLLSLRDAGHDNAYLLARSDEGFARAIDLHLVSRHDMEGGKDAPVRVRVRLGGYSLHLGDDYEDIPRIRTDEGLFFDLETLQTRLSTHKVPKADVSFMADVASQNFTAAVFRVARRSEHVRLVFP